MGPNEKERGRPALLGLGLPTGSRRTGSCWTRDWVFLNRIRDWVIVNRIRGLGPREVITRTGLIRGVGLRGSGSS